MARTDPFFNAESQVRSNSQGDGQTQTQRDTQKAQGRLQLDTQSAQDRTQGGTGADKLNRRIAAQENPQQQEALFVELQTPMTTGSIALPSFQAILCVDGAPFGVTINGIIGEEVT